MGGGATNGLAVHSGSLCECAFVCICDFVGLCRGRYQASTARGSGYDRGTGSA